jgi:hypothetical protein
MSVQEFTTRRAIEEKKNPAGAGQVSLAGMLPMVSSEVAYVSFI